MSISPEKKKLWTFVINVDPCNSVQKYSLIWICTCGISLSEVFKKTYKLQTMEPCSMDGPKYTMVENLAQEEHGGGVGRRDLETI